MEFEGPYLFGNIGSAYKISIIMVSDIFLMIAIRTLYLGKRKVNTVGDSKLGIYCHSAIFSHQGPRQCSTLLISEFVLLSKGDDAASFKYFQFPSIANRHLLSGETTDKGLS